MIPPEYLVGITTKFNLTEEYYYFAAYLYKEYGKPYRVTKYRKKNNLKCGEIHCMTIQYSTFDDNLIDNLDHWQMSRPMIVPLPIHTPPTIM